VTPGALTYSIQATYDDVPQSLVNADGCKLVATCTGIVHFAPPLRTLGTSRQFNKMTGTSSKAQCPPNDLALLGTPGFQTFKTPMDSLNSWLCT